MVNLQRGWIYEIPDAALTLPPETLRGEAHKEKRPFLILSNNDDNLNEAFLIVSGCPISTSTRYRTRFDVKLHVGTAGLPKKRWVRIPALQPIPKSVFDAHYRKGCLSGSQLEEVEATVAEFLDLG